MQKQYRGSSCVKYEGKEYNLDYYVVSENKVFCEEENPRVTYGIEIMENGEISEIVNDISLDENKIFNMIEIMKKYDAMPVHLHDIVENMI